MAETQVQAKQNLRGQVSQGTARIRAASGAEDYRRGFYFLSGLVKFLSLVIFALMVGNLYMAYSWHPQDSYYAENFESKKRRLYAFGEPVLSQEALLTWASNAATEVMTFGFNDFNTRVLATERLFTKEGWVKFVPVIANSSLLANIKASQQIMTAVPHSTPVVVSEGVISGKYTWYVQVPLLLTIRAGDMKTVDKIKVMMEIVKVPTSEMPAGIGINLWKSK